MIELEAYWMNNIKSSVVIDQILENYVRDRVSYIVLDLSYINSFLLVQLPPIIPYSSFHFCYSRPVIPDKFSIKIEKDRFDKIKNDSVIPLGGYISTCVSLDTRRFFEEKGYEFNSLFEKIIVYVVEILLKEEKISV